MTEQRDLNWQQMTLKYIKKISESVINSDSSVVDDAIECHIFAFIAEQAQRYSDYFAFMINMCFQHHL